MTKQLTPPPGWREKVRRLTEINDRAHRELCDQRNGRFAGTKFQRSREMIWRLMALRP